MLAYEHILADLFGARRRGIDFGLERVEARLGELGLNTSQCMGVQIGGTNGKGSAAAFVESALLHSGLSVGLFTSPHLMSLRERFRINGNLASEEEVVASYRATCEGKDALSFFESLTVMAAWMFREAKVEVAIYEVGLGGRLDSTTALPMDISAVTGIGLDHQEFLGDSLEAIAVEKAGIFRKGKAAIIGDSAKHRIRGLLVDAALQAGAKPRLVGAAEYEQIPQELTLQGEHIRRNAAVAVAIVAALRQLGCALGNDAIQGFSSARILGRWQQIDAHLWFDGAHNAQASRALAAHARSLHPRWQLVVGISKEKNAKEFLRPWNGLADQIIATEAANERAICTAKIAEASQSLGLLCVEEAELEQALRRAQSSALPTVLTGSLLLVGDALRLQGQNGKGNLGPCDPVQVQDPSVATQS